MGVGLMYKPDDRHTQLLYWHREDGSTFTIRLLPSMEIKGASRFNTSPCLACITRPISHGERTESCTPNSRKWDADSSVNGRQAANHSRSNLGSVESTNSPLSVSIS